ncbi:hypothetical protein Vafri_17706 [Volvox africanus]|uniref:NAD-dependent epimerase/dehydratase domain-containing protein n=1 Tax=Volvox africanus TaxID=51714 RepID=A0A8J4F7Q6_9CHLO|nr:hypothetical protein Vafri_17706 [Volvox africanus]
MAGLAPEGSHLATPWIKQGARIHVREARTTGKRLPYMCIGLFLPVIPSGNVPHMRAAFTLHVMISVYYFFKTAAGQVRCLTRQPTPELLELEKRFGSRVKLCNGWVLDATDMCGSMDPRVRGLPWFLGGWVDSGQWLGFWVSEQCHVSPKGSIASLPVAPLCAAPGSVCNTQPQPVHRIRRDMLGPACRTTVAPHLTTDGGCDGLINCAAHYRWWSRSPDLFTALNEAAVSELMKLALETHVKRVVQVSTILAMGCPPGDWGSDVRPLKPDTPPGPSASRYARSKAAGDEVVLRLAAEAGLPGCVVMLACVVGADRRLVSGGEEDVMRIADLVRGKVPATLGHDTVFTYIGVHDAAAAIIAALLRGRPGGRYLVGNQRLTTGEFYDVISRLSGVPAPSRRVPVWVAAMWAAAAGSWGALTGMPPQAPPDLIRTVSYGTLLFDSASSEVELGLQVPYRDITESFREAVQYVQEYDRLQG